MISFSLLSTLSEKFSVGDINIFIINLVVAVILVLIGLLLSMFIKLILRKLIDKAGLGRTAKKSFIELFLAVIKWSIYLLFISLALDQLGIPQLTNWLTAILVVIPALVGALLLILAGFGIAVYLRDLIEESKIVNWELLSNIIFYFILYIFMIYAIKTALIGQDKNTVNMIIIILTAVVSAAIAFRYVLKKR